MPTTTSSRQSESPQDRPHHQSNVLRSRGRDPQSSHVSVRTQGGSLPLDPAGTLGGQCWRVCVSTRTYAGSTGVRVSAACASWLGAERRSCPPALDAPDIVFSSPIPPMTNRHTPSSITHVPLACGTRRHRTTGKPSSHAEHVSPCLARSSLRTAACRGTSRFGC